MTARTAAARAAWGTLAVAVLAQVGYPLVDGDPLRVVTVAIVCLLAAAMVAAAAAAYGAAVAVTVLAVTAAGGLLAEVVGVRTGYPFGAYTYDGTLGTQVADVPLVVPLAWTMVGYPSFVAARRLSTAARRPAATPVVGAVAMAGWDVFLDPQMVADGRWRWRFPEPHLPFVDSVPVTNLVGWLVVGLVLTAVLHMLLPRDVGTAAVARDAVPAVALLWGYAGYVVGNLAFFGEPGVALTGGVAMGLVAVPYAVVLLRAARR